MTSTKQYNQTKKNAQHKPAMTNREWLESLSDEEFAESLLGAFKIFIMVDRTVGTKENDSRAVSLQKHIEWLRSKHKN